VSLVSAVVIGILLAGAAQAAPAAGPAPDACRLLTAEDIRQVQHAPLKNAKPSVERVAAEEFAQCFFATTDYTHSVSLTVIRGAAGTPASTEAYWRRTFENDREATARAAAPTGRRVKKQEPATRVPDIGRAAYWAGDERAGALYVLADDAVLRISVGGVADEKERLRRSRVLAEAALKRLSHPGPAARHPGLETLRTRPASRSQPFAVRIRACCRTDWPAARDAQLWSRPRRRG
jgi:hypothetical protein